MVRPRASGRAQPPRPPHHMGANMVGLLSTCWSAEISQQSDGPRTSNVRATAADESVRRLPREYHRWAPRWARPRGPTFPWGGPRLPGSRACARRGCRTVPARRRVTPQKPLTSKASGRRRPGWPGEEGRSRTRAAIQRGSCSNLGGCGDKLADRALARPLRTGSRQGQHGLRE